MAAFPTGENEQPIYGPQAIWTVPFRQNPYFVPRVDVFAQIEAGVSQSRFVILHGPSGVGKTQIAVEYSSRYRRRFSQAHVLWIHAGNADQIRRTYEVIAQKLTLPNFVLHPVDVLQVVSNWIKREGADPRRDQWLMVWDDFGLLAKPKAEERLLSQYFAALQRLVSGLSSHNGVLMVTTQCQDTVATLGTKISSVEVCSFTRKESVALLRARRPHVWIEPGSADILDHLLDSLQDIPFALTHLIAAIHPRSGRSVKEVADTLLAMASHDEDFVSGEFQLSGHGINGSSPMLKSWNLVFQLLVLDGQQTPYLLSFMSFLDSDHIPVTLLTNARPTTNVTGVLAILLQHSIMVVETEVGFLSMHSLVQAFVRCWLNKNNSYSSLARMALQTMSSILAGEGLEDPTTCRQLIPHAKSILQHNLSLGRSVEVADLLHYIAHHEWRLGCFEEAYELVSDAVSARKALLGDEAEATLSSLSLMALLLRCLGRYDEAYETNRRNLSIYIRVLGPDHTNTLMCSNNLALVLRSQGKDEEAEDLSRGTLQRCERVFGARHACTSTAMLNLALLLANQGKLEEAEAMSRIALKTRENAVPYEHLSTLTSCYCLAHVLHCRGAYDEASALYRRAYYGFRHVLGASHSLTLACESQFLELLNETFIFVVDRLSHTAEER